MSIFEPWTSPWTSRMLSLLRIVVGLIFISAGTTKLIGFPPGSIPIALLEIVGGTLITLGLLTRPVAFVLAGEMAVAALRLASVQSQWPVLLGFLFLYLSFAGPGVWSLDLLVARAMWARRIQERARQLEKGLMPERRRMPRAKLRRA